jgi:hypothetical protein
MLPILPPINLVSLNITLIFILCFKYWIYRAGKDEEVAHGLAEHHPLNFWTKACPPFPLLGARQMVMPPQWRFATGRVRLPDAS